MPVPKDMTFPKDSTKNKTKNGPQNGTPHVIVVDEEKCFPILTENVLFLI